MIYSYICDGISISHQTTFRTPFQPIILTCNRTHERPLAIVRAEESIRTEFLTLLLRHIVDSRSTENVTPTWNPTFTNIMPPYGISVRVYAKVEVLPTQATLLACGYCKGLYDSRVLINACYHGVYAGGMILKLPYPGYFQYTSDTVSLIKSTLTRIFTSGKHVTFENFVIAVDQLSSCGLTAQEMQRPARGPTAQATQRRMSQDCRKYIEFQVSGGSFEHEPRISVSNGQDRG